MVSTRRASALQSGPERSRRGGFGPPKSALELLEAPRWPLQRCRLLPQQIDEAIPIEVEEVPEELVGRLGFDPLGQIPEVGEVARDDDLSASFDRGGSDMGV